MKTILSTPILILATVVSVLAQTNAYYEGDRASQKPYWEVTTDPKTNGTSIRYYDAAKQLLHEEFLPNQLVKLTKRNVRRLNENLVLVSGNQQKPSQLVSVALPYSTENERVARARIRVMAAERKASGADLVARIVPTTDGEKPIIKVFLYNPQQERFRIAILNKSGRAVCEQYDNGLQGNYRFNMAFMPQGDYTVKIFKLGRKVPVVSSQLSLSRKPSQTFFTVKMPSDTNALVAN